MRQQARVQRRGDGEHAQQPEQTVKTDWPDTAAERPRVESQRATRQRPQETQRKIVPGEPRNRSGIAQPRNVAPGAAEEVVELEHSPLHRRDPSRQHRPMNDIVEQQR
jgi:hypothetical protein